MVGATETNKGPEVAPMGMVIIMDVLLHELMVTAAPFSNTRLPFWELANPEPEITT
jgi:hypothetical protein